MLVQPFEAENKYSREMDGKAVDGYGGIPWAKCFCPTGIYHTFKEILGFSLDLVTWLLFYLKDNWSSI